MGEDVDAERVERPARVVVFGGRDIWLSVYALDHWLAVFGLSPGGFELVEGEAKGVDVSARRWAEHHGMVPMKFFADWRRLKRAAGPVRNSAMADYADRGVGFIKQGSSGTANMRDQMHRRDKPVEMVDVEFLPDGYDGSEESL